MNIVLVYIIDGITDTLIINNGNQPAKLMEEYFL
jgi:hypothetical protein